ncbi:SRPBCC family protein [Streptomyces armeniacus]
MPRFSMAQTLSTAVPQVFEYLADPRNMPEWNSGVAEVEDRRVPARLGARYRYRFPGRHRFHHLECCAYRSPSLLAFRGERMWTPLGTQTVAYTFRVRAAARGSTVEATVDVRVQGGMLLLLPVITLGWRRDLPVDLKRLRDTLDPAAADQPAAAWRGYVEPGTPRPLRAEQPAARTEVHRVPARLEPGGRVGPEAA